MTDEIPVDGTPSRHEAVSPDGVTEAGVNSPISLATPTWPASAGLIIGGVSLALVGGVIAVFAQFTAKDGTSGVVIGGAMALAGIIASLLGVWRAATTLDKLGEKFLAAKDTDAG